MKRYWMILLCALALGLGACTKPDNTSNTGDTEEPAPTPEPAVDTEQLNTYKYVNTFVRNQMNLYYLWNKEISKDLATWTDSEEPIAKVKEIRYHSGSGSNRKDIDKWSMVTDDYEDFYGSTNGNGETAGLDFVFYYYDESHTSVCAVVRYVYKDSPADKAGLKRGDVIVKVNGKTIPYSENNTSDYEKAYYTLVGSDKFTVGTLDDRTLTLQPVEMYEDPVHLTEVFTAGSKKIGYLHYTSFTLDSCEDLVDVFREFKNQGVKELILDLRYNPGGFSKTEQVFASLLAPEAEVQKGSILSTEVYNENLTQYFSERSVDTNTYLETEYEFTSGNKTYQFSTAGANPGLEKIYVIITGSSASASEALVCDLLPYMPLTLIGAQSRGKYTAGLVLSADDFYTDNADQLGKTFTQNGLKYAKNWGAYVMYARFADKNGQTPCMPDGLTPDIEATDDPLDGYPLGDPRETMLAVALEQCGYKTSAPAAVRRSDKRMQQLTPAGLETVSPERDGLMVVLPGQRNLR